MVQHLHKRLSRAIENGHLDGVNVDEDVVNFARIDRGKKVLRRGKQHTLFHQAGGVTDASDVVPFSFDREIVEVNAAKNNSGIRRRGSQANVAIHASVKAHALRFSRSRYGALKHGATLQWVNFSTLSSTYSVLCALLSTGYRSLEAHPQFRCGNLATNCRIACVFLELLTSN